MEKEDINALDEIHKGSYMGMDAIKYVLDKVEDSKLADVLDNQYKHYKEVAERIEDIYSKYDDGEPHKTGVMNKAMTWFGIEKETLMDNSDSKIAELLLNGVNMGIIEGKKILNNKKINSEVSKIVDEYISMQEESVEVLKEYL